MSREKAKEIIEEVANWFDQQNQGADDTPITWVNESIVDTVAALLPAETCDGLEQGCSCSACKIQRLIKDKTASNDKIRRRDVRIDDLESICSGKREVIVAWQDASKDQEAIIERKDNELMDLTLLKEQTERAVQLAKETIDRKNEGLRLTGITCKEQEAALTTCRGTVGNLEIQTSALAEDLEKHKDVMKFQGETIQKQSDVIDIQVETIDQRDEEIETQKNDIVKLETTLEAKAGQIQEYDHEILQLTGEGLRVKPPDSLGQMDDAAMIAIMNDVRNGRKIQAIKNLRRTEIQFTYPFPGQSRGPRLIGHLSLKHSKEIIDGFQRSLDELSKQKFGDEKETIDAYNRQVEELRGLISDRDATLESIKVRRDKQSELFEKQCETIENLRATIRANSESYLKLEAKLKDVERVKDSLKTGDYEHMKSENLRLAAEVSSYSRAMKEKADYATGLEDNVEFLREQIQKKEGTIQTIKSNYLDVCEKNQGLRSQVAGLTTDRDKYIESEGRLRSKIEELERHNAQWAEVDEKLRGQITEIQNEKHALKEERIVLETTNEALSEQNGELVESMREMSAQMSRLVEDNE